MSEVTIDFITRNPWQMVLVEEGPWTDVEENFRRLQDRLYSCVEAAIDGELARIYPESSGATVTIRLDGYSLPEPEAQDFFRAFSSSVLELPDYKASLAKSPHVSGIKFVGHFEQ